MGLKNLELKLSYRSDIDNIYEDFYEKCIEKSIKYDRASGYFTSGSLVLMARGLEEFIFKNGKIRIVASPKLSEDDIDAIERGEKNKAQVITDMVLSNLVPNKQMIENDTLNVLAWLIEKNILEIKLSFTENLRGIYHEKFGIFYDISNEKVAFTGSANETIGGLKDNFESIDIFFSTNEGDNRRIQEKINNFEKLWNNETKNLKVIEFPKVAKEKIISYKREYPINKEKKLELGKEKIEMIEPFTLPHWLEVREYQKKAFESWKNAGGKGILEMATGTGKTITALYILSELNKIAKTKEIKTIFLIICPLKHLVQQWSEEFLNFNKKTIKCFSDNKNWKNDLEKKIRLYNLDVIDNISIIVTQDTFATENFIESFNMIKNKYNFVVIVDECHNIGTKNFEKNFNKIGEIKYIIGLSATPDRHGDEEGNNIIKNLLGDIVFTFSMEQAIKEGFLTKYYYYPIPVELAEEERINYYNLTYKINKMMISLSDEDKKENEILKILLIKRSKIIQLASNKIMKLKNLLINSPHRKNNLIYVGPGRRSENEEREVIQITKMLGIDLGMNVAKFTSEESKERREEILDSFKRKELDALVAIKCLDEGVNIPSIETAYIIGSTTNRREYIQRRGRVLRLSKGKEYAYIYDFIVVPTHYSEVGSLPSDIFNIERNLLKKELERVNEYAELCENRFSYLGDFFEYKQAFNLLDI